jgi:hypothetical protein
LAIHPMTKVTGVLAILNKTKKQYSRIRERGLSSCNCIWKMIEKEIRLNPRDEERPEPAYGQVNKS